MKSKFSLVATLTLMSSIAVSELSAIEHKLEISEGWNHINLPIAVSNDTPGFILDKVKNDTEVIWGKGESNNWLSYVPDLGDLNDLEKIEVAKAYFLKSTNNAEPTIIGTKSVQKLNFENGWNLFTIFHEPISIADFEQQVTDKVGIDKLESAYIFTKNDAGVGFWYYYTPSRTDEYGNPVSFTGTELEPKSFIYMKFKELSENLELDFSFGVNEANIGIVSQDSNETDVKLFVEALETSQTNNTNTPDDLVDENNLPNVIKIYSLDGGKLFNVNIPGEYANSDHVEVEVENRARFDLNLTNVNAGDVVAVDNLTSGFFPTPTRDHEAFFSKSSIEDFDTQANETVSTDITIFNGGNEDLTFSIVTASVFEPLASGTSATSLVASTTTKEVLNLDGTTSTTEVKVLKSSGFSATADDLLVRIYIPDFVSDTLRDDIIAVDNATYSDINDRRNEVNRLKNLVNAELDTLNQDLVGLVPNTDEWNEVMDKKDAMEVLLSDLNILMDEPTGDETTPEDGSDTTITLSEDPVFVDVIVDTGDDVSIDNAPEISYLREARLDSDWIRFRLAFSNFSSVDKDENPYAVVAFNSTEDDSDGQISPADDTFMTDLYAYYDFNYDEVVIVNLATNTTYVTSHTTRWNGIEFDLPEYMFERKKRIPTKVYSYNKFGSYQDISDVAPNDGVGYFDIESIVYPSVESGTIEPQDYTTIIFDFKPYQEGSYSNIIQITTNDTVRDVVKYENTVTASGDTTAPASIDDLSADSSTFDSVTLSWTAVGDNGTEGSNVTKYDILVSTDSTFATYETIKVIENIVSAGETQTFEVTDLDDGINYYFGIIAYDLAGNQSATIQNFQDGTISGVDKTTSSAPVFDLNVTSITLTVTEGEAQNPVLVKVTNSGGSDLEFEFDSFSYPSDLNSTSVLASAESFSFNSASLSATMTTSENQNVDFTSSDIANNGFIIKYKDSFSASSFSALSTSATKEKTLKNGAVLYNAEALSFENYVNLMDNLASDSNVEYVEPNFKFKATAVDTELSNSWWITNLSGEDAWNLSTGTDIIVAIIDSGVDIDHSELNDHIWTNDDEIAGNGVDDDGNDYIDDVNGFHFNGSTRDSNVSDDFGHGTHCAGIVGAKRDNSVMVGIAPDVKIMPVKALDYEGNGNLADIIEAIYYAVDNGADVINMSLGADTYSSTLKEAVDYAGDNDILVISASGNEGTNNDLHPFYPASFTSENVISVGASNDLDELASFSNYGSTSVDIVASGTSILSTVPDFVAKEDATAPVGYDTYQGTSMATPIVAGAVALLKAYNPSYTSDEIKALILDNADEIDSLDGYIAGNRKLNIYNSISNAIPSLTHWIDYNSDESKTLSANEDYDIEFTFDTSNLAVGSYQTEAIFYTNIQDDPFTLSVYLDVVSAD